MSGRSEMDFDGFEMVKVVFVFNVHAAWFTVAACGLVTYCKIFLLSFVLFVVSNWQENRVLLCSLFPIVVTCF